MQRHNSLDLDRMVLWVSACALTMMAYGIYRDSEALRDAQHMVGDWSVRGDAIAASRPLVVAQDACSGLGLSFNDCASLPEPIAYEIAVGAIAASAVARRAEFFERCKPHYRVDSCVVLLDRTVRIRQALRRVEGRGFGEQYGDRGPGPAQ